MSLVFDFDEVFDRIMKEMGVVFVPIYVIDFPKFFQAQFSEMDRHQPEKGDGWKGMSSSDLMVLYDKISLELHKRYTAGDVKGFISQTIDTGNVLAMLYTNVKERGI